MQMQIDDLVNFCAYYTLTKTAVKLPLAHLTPTQEQPQEKQKPLKVTRKKFEAEPKKAERVGVGKAKMEYVSKVAQRSVSPIHQSYPREPREEKNTTYDINYFVSHLATETEPNRSNWHEPRPKEQGGYQTQGYQQGYKNQGYQTQGYQQQGYQQQQPSRRQESNLQNYETFGRSAVRMAEYENFEDKMRRDNRGHLTDRYQKPDYTASQLIGRSEQRNQAGNNSWMLPLQTVLKTNKPKFIDVDSRKPQFYAGPTFENLNWQQSESKISYSPARREFTPTNSTSASKLTDSHLSKSRTKHQRKKSERPFYDTSKLTVKKESEPISRDHRIEPTVLSQSFISVEEANSYPRKMMGEEAKRQTSTTAPPLRNNRQFKPSVRQERNETDLDDALAQTLTELSHRPVPVAFDLKMKGDY